MQREELVPETNAKGLFYAIYWGTGKVRGGVNWWIVRATNGACVCYIRDTRGYGTGTRGKRLVESDIMCPV